MRKKRWKGGGIKHSALARRFGLRVLNDCTKLLLNNLND